MDFIDSLITLALAEDSGMGDVTTLSLLESDFRGSGVIVAKEPMVLAGLGVASRVFTTVDPGVMLHTGFEDGGRAGKDDIVMKIEGDLACMLKAERIVLNFLQHLSGIATLTRKFVDRIGHSRVKLVDTRKTTPGLRLLEKQAVRAGGAHNHRMSLYDGILIKDNHIAVAGGVRQAIKTVRENVSHLMKIEVETSSLKEVKEAVDEGADVIMLDNMNVSQMRKAVEYIDGRAVVEASGNVSLERIERIAGTGVDVISCGALTHQARSMDLSMRISPE
ncbi:MAG: carboxylating nicotinate-nucleotide diphosphorylase [Desulfobacteraceae bacterium]|nr:MAG: carboxylating nicotinate-nucleotide diphosphorylase [Desulfobacteraceae bacterium]